MTAVNEDVKFEFMLPKSAYADYITPGLAGSVNANDRSSNRMIPFEVDTNNSDAVASASAPASLSAQAASAPSHQVTTGNKALTFNTALLKEEAYADYGFSGLAGSDNEEDEEVDTNNSDAVASESAPASLSAQAASAPASLSAQAASAPASSTRALFFLDTQRDKLQLEISNFDKMFTSYTQDQETLRGCTFATVS